MKIDIVARRVHSLYLPLSSSYTHGLFFSLSLTFFLHTYQPSSSFRHSSSSSSLSVSLLVVSRKGERESERAIKRKRERMGVNSMLCDFGYYYHHVYRPRASQLV